MSEIEALRVKLSQVETMHQERMLEASEEMKRKDLYIVKLEKQVNEMTRHYNS